MKINYVLSILFLCVAFLLYKKKKEKLSIVFNVIYFFCFLFCYQTLVVCLLSFFKLGGCLFNYSIINYLVGVFFLIPCLKKKEVQKYYFNRKEFYSVLVITLIMFMVTWIRFDGFQSISYASDDSAFHYKTSLVFSKVLEKLDYSNSIDIIHKDFNGVMPISYVNGGFFINLFSNFSPYKVYFIYDSYCLIMSALLFFVTIFSVFKMKDYFNAIVFTLLYALSYPLNSLLFGFAYLGLGVLTINLLLVTVIFMGSSFDKKVLFNLFILFIISFSVYFSYYFFVPFVYLALGLYYISLMKKKKVSFMYLMLYGVITLVIPFIIGCLTFILPTFKSSAIGVFGAVSLNGDIYNNFLPVLFFILFSFYCVYKKFNYLKEFKFFNYIFNTLSVYVLIFFVLNILRISGYYYFYKLFYVYFMFVFIYFSYSLINYKKIIYGVCLVIIIGCVIVLMFPNSGFSSVLEKSLIYSYNARKFSKDRVRFTKDELVLVDEARKNKDVCIHNDEFLLVGKNSKNVWFYEIVGGIPVLNHFSNNREQLYFPNISFSTWEKHSEYPCVLIFYDNDFKYNIDNYEVIFSNDGGVLIKR